MIQIMLDIPSAQLIVNRAHHPAGEYAYSPTDFALSVNFRKCSVEMAFDGVAWEGISVPGDIKVMPAGQTRIFRHREDCQFAHIIIRDAGMSNVIGATADLRPYAVLRDKPLQYLINALLAESELGPTTALFQNAVAAAIVARLRELDGGRKRPLTHRLPDYALSRVIDFLHARLAENVSVADLASIAGLSPAHFSTLFRNSVGEPPHRYHTRLRVERARQLIEQGVTPSDAAIQVGFFDQSHLARHMRRLIGATPAKLRQRRPKGTFQKPAITIEPSTRR